MSSLAKMESTYLVKNHHLRTSNGSSGLNWTSILWERRQHSSVRKWISSTRPSVGGPASCARLTTSPWLESVGSTSSWSLVVRIFLHGDVSLEFHRGEQQVHRGRPAHAGSIQLHCEVDGLWGRPTRFCACDPVEAWCAWKWMLLTWKNVKEWESWHGQSPWPWYLGSIVNHGPRGSTLCWFLGSVASQMFMNHLFEMLNVSCALFHRKSKKKRDRVRTMVEPVCCTGIASIPYGCDLGWIGSSPRGLWSLYMMF